jgi:5-methylthioadenosine/S-adenosylhomocysteine deaminase
MIKTELDLLVFGSLLLTMSSQQAVVEHPVLGIRDGKIVFVMPRKDSRRGLLRKKVPYRRDTQLCPG